MLSSISKLSFFLLLPLFFLAVRPCSEAGVPRSALQTAHVDLQHRLREEELHAALQLHGQELQPDTTSQVRRCFCCSTSTFRLMTTQSKICMHEYEVLRGKTHKKKVEIFLTAFSALIMKHSPGSRL